MMLTLKKASRVEVRGSAADALSRTRPKTLAPMEFGRPSINLRVRDSTTVTSEVVLSDLGDGYRVEWGRADGGIV